MERQIWRKYTEDHVYLVNVHRGRVVAAMGPVPYTDAINLWPQRLAVTNRPALVAELDGQQDYYLRTALSLERGIVTAPRELVDDDRLVVTPYPRSAHDGYIGQGQPVTIMGPQLDNSGVGGAWTGVPIVGRVEMTFGEIRRHISQSRINGMNRIASNPVRLGYHAR